MNDERVIPYFRIYKYHYEICGNEIPLNNKQLLQVIGSEEIPYVPLIDKKYIIHIKFQDFAGYSNRQPINGLTEVMKLEYPWDDLIKSIKENGIIKPLLAERLVINKNKVYYHAFEGRHRMCALSLVEPYNPDTLIPTIVVDMDCDYTEYMRNTTEFPRIKEEWYNPRKKQI